MRHEDRARFSCNALWPKCASRLTASLALNPDCRLLSRRCAASSMVSVCQLLSLTGMAESPPENGILHAMGYTPLHSPHTTRAISIHAHPGAIRQMLASC